VVAPTERRQRRTVALDSIWGFAEDGSSGRSKRLRIEKSNNLIASVHTVLTDVRCWFTHETLPFAYMQWLTTNRQHDGSPTCSRERRKHCVAVDINLNPEHKTLEGTLADDLK